MRLVRCDAVDVGTGRLRLNGFSRGSWVVVELEGNVLICGEVDCARWSGVGCGTADVLMWKGCRAKPTIAEEGMFVKATRVCVVDECVVLEVGLDEAVLRGVESKLWATQMLRELLQDRVIDGDGWLFDGGVVVGTVALSGRGLVTRKTELRVKSSSSRVTTTKRHKVGGLDKIFEEVRHTVLRGGGMLLKGPPGTGKTALVRAVCEEEEVPLLYVHGTCSATMMSRAFAEAERLTQSGAAKRAVVFVDETDVLRNAGDLALLLDKRVAGCVAVCGATNGQVHESLRRPGRFDRECLVGIPTAAARREIIHIHAARAGLLVPAEQAEELQQRTVGYVGADLVALVREMGEAAGGERTARREHVERALVRVGPSPMRGAAVEVPSVRWEEIGGLEKVKEQLRRAVEWPITRAKEMKMMGVRAVRGVLLHGPPGCAKTTLVRALATNIRASFLMLTTETVYSPFVGSAEKTVRDCFERARGVVPCIVFIDELEAMVSKRGNSNEGHSVQQRVLATLLNEMDGLDTNEETVVIVVAATNRLDMLDEALVRPGRFDNLLFVPPPQTIEEVLAVLRVHSRSMRLDGDVDLAAVARKCVGMSGAQLERVCREAGMEALRENLNIESVGAKHFQAAVASNGDD